MKWHKVKDLLYHEKYRDAEELIGQYCAFCYDAGADTKKHDFPCSRCRIDHNLCYDWASEGLISKIEIAKTISELVDLVDEMVEELEECYYVKPEVFLFPGENTDYYLGKL